VIVTARQARILERELGQSLEWIDVATFGDHEPKVLILTPRCVYCGTLNQTGQCGRCGASVLRAGAAR